MEQSSDPVHRLNKALGDIFPSRYDGSAHYTRQVIQPIEFAMLNNLNSLESKIVKYAIRNKEDKDIDKAIDCLNKLREWRNHEKARQYNPIP